MSIPLLPEALSGRPVAQVLIADSAAPVRILFTEQLSQLLGKSVTTIRTFATNEKYKHLIPRPFKMPGSRRLCWYEHEVLEWIKPCRPAVLTPKRPRGRPTKAEQRRYARMEGGQ